MSPPNDTVMSDPSPAYATRFKPVENSHGPCLGMLPHFVKSLFLQASHSSEHRLARNFPLPAHNEFMMKSCGSAKNSAHTAKSLIPGNLRISPFFFRILAGMAASIQFKTMS